MYPEISPVKASKLPRNTHPQHHYATTMPEATKNLCFRISFSLFLLTIISTSMEIIKEKLMRW